MSVCTESNYIPFDSIHGIWRTKLDDEQMTSSSNFGCLWKLHPEEFPSIFLHGRHVQLPRWQQAYGANYYFSGQTSEARSIPEILVDYLNWGQRSIDARLNGLLINWYDDQQGHYIGSHRDSTKGLVKRTCIAMMSLGSARVMRFRPIKQPGFIDIEVENGDVIVMPLQTNANFKHEIPKLKRYDGKRISITMRCFEDKIVES